MCEGGTFFVRVFYLNTSNEESGATCLVNVRTFCEQHLQPLRLNVLTMLQFEYVFLSVDNLYL